MSYKTWTTYGYGFCASNINTTPKKLLKLAGMKQKVLDDIHSLFLYEFGNIPKNEDLTMEDFDLLEGEYYEHGITYVLMRVIDEFPVCFADDYDGNEYLLYCPSYPWSRSDKEWDLTSEKVTEVFQKYIDVLTDEYVDIDYQEVENGG